MFDPEPEFNFDLELDFDKIVASTQDLKNSRQILIDDVQMAQTIINKLKTDSVLNYVEREEYIVRFEQQCKINNFLIDKLSQVISIREITGDSHVVD